MFRNVSVLTLVLMAVVVNSRPDDRTHLKCPSTSNCTCIEYSELEIQCPRFDPHIFVRIQPNNYVHFECENITSNEFEMVPDFELDEAGFLQITKCPLPKGKSVASYLKNIHIKRIRSFQFVSSGVNRHIPVESHHFRGLDDIERFDLRGMENEIKELPSDVFVGMKKLTWVRIRVANIRLPRDIFAPLENLEFLELGHNKLQSLEPGFLKNQRKLQQLNLWGNSLSNLKKDSFVGLDLVKELDLSGNGMESLEADVFYHLANLTDINLSANNFASLPDGLFENNRKMKNFRLLENRVSLDKLPADLLSNMTDLKSVVIKCDLKEIHEDIFYGSENIEIIKLDFNALKILPELLFDSQTQLQRLDLSGNLIEELGEKLFYNTRSLTELRFSKNKLKRISKNAFKNLISLQKLYLDNNEIAFIDSQAFVGITSVDFIALQNNQLTFEGNGDVEINGEMIKLKGESPFQTLAKLATLNLSFNKMASMFEDFTLINLMNLNLSHNNISILTTDDIQSFMHEGLTIDFSHNNIEEFHYEASYELGPESVNLILTDNPIACDCKILGFVRYLKNRNQERGSSMQVTVGDLKCASPIGMRDRTVTSLNATELVCPLDNEASEVGKRCPDRCSCLVRPDDKSLLIDCDASMNVTQLPPASELSLQKYELTMENRNLTEIPTLAAFSEITKLFLGSNKITEISLGNLPRNISVLELQNNELRTLNESVIKFLTESSSKLKLSGNPWRCDCSNKAFITFVRNIYQRIEDKENMTCDDGQKMSDLNDGDLCSESKVFIMIISFATAIMGLLLGGLAALYYKYQKQIKMWMYSHNLCLWFVTEEELDKDKRYDAFVSYSHRDNDFVADYLLPELENGTIPYKLCVHERDWSPGLEISTQISNSVNDAKRTIIVMSPHYLQSNWAQWEFRVAQSHAATEKRSRIIVILYGDIGDINKLEPDIRDYLKLNTYVKWGDKWFWEKLKYAMPHMKKSEKQEKTKGLVKNSMKSSVDDKLELIKPVSVTPPQLTTPPAEKVANPLITSLNAKNANQNGKGHNGYNGHINGAFVINTSSRQSDV